MCLQKNKDGSRGEKEGCSNSIEKAKDYLKALYANTDDAPKKENKSMKMKKSELLALIKEEIMAEAEMFKMSPEDLRDFSQPDPPEYQAADEIFNMVMEDLEKEVEYDLLDIIKEIMMERPGQKPQDMANEAFGKLMDKMRGGGGVSYRPMQEGIEGIMDPANQQLMIDAVEKLAPLVGVMSLPVVIGAIYEKLKAMGAK